MPASITLFSLRNRWCGWVELSSWLCTGCIIEIRDWWPTHRVLDLQYILWKYPEYVLIRTKSRWYSDLLNILGSYKQGHDLFHIQLVSQFSFWIFILFEDCELTRLVRITFLMPLHSFERNWPIFNWTE